MKPGMQLALAALGGFAGGAILMGLAASQQAAAQAAQNAALNAAAPTPGTAPTLVCTGQTLNSGWMYLVTIVVPGGDLTQSATVATAAAAMVAAGFVDPSTKSTPTITPVNTTATTATPTTSPTTIGQALTVFNGSTGATVPAPTATLIYANVYGMPSPEGLTTA
jgi:hypothetical protein